MTLQISGTSGVSFPDASSQYSAGFIPFRNRFFNGSMIVDQRASATTAITYQTSGNPTTGDNYSADRWKAFNTRTNGGTLTAQIVATSGAALTGGFPLALKYTNTTGGVSAANDSVIALQPIEANNIYDFEWGSAGATSAVLSFWVSASIAGTYAVAVRNAALNRSYVATFTVNSANTYEFKSLVIPGDTAGTWALTGNGIGLQVSFDLGVGSTYCTSTYGSWQANNYFGGAATVKLSATTGATFSITGLQFEKGAVATPFEFRPYPAELALCQRYYENSYDPGVVPGTASAVAGSETLYGSSGVASAFNGGGIPVSFKVTKRTGSYTPVVYSPATGSSGQLRNNSALVDVAATVDAVGARGFRAYGSITAGTLLNLSCHWVASAEL